MAILLAAIAVLTVPDLRAGLLRHTSLLPAGAGGPVLVDDAAALAAMAAIGEAVDAADAAPPITRAMMDEVRSHSHTVAFLGSMGDSQSAHKLPAAKVSSVQVESLGRYITRKYRVSNEATRMLISTAYGVGQEMGLDPLLLLAIIAIESSFNPFAESHVGAQGLMQVLTRVHTEKFEPFGGEQAAWNPVANIRVGATILKEYIGRGGSVVAGLRMYVGVAPDGSSPYGEKVLAERRRLASAAGVIADPPGSLPAAPARSASAAPATDAEKARMRGVEAVPTVM